MSMGRFCFKRLCYGISSASKHFLPRISAILHGLKGVVRLIDDILIFDRDQAEHDARLLAALRRLQDARIIPNEKCEISMPELKFFGHIVSVAGIRPDNDKVKAITNMKSLTNVTEVLCFLGMVNQLTKISSILADLSAPIRKLLRKNRDWVWSSAQKRDISQDQGGLLFSTDTYIL